MKEDKGKQKKEKRNGRNEKQKAKNQKLNRNGKLKKNTSLAAKGALTLTHRLQHLTSCLIQMADGVWK